MTPIMWLHYLVLLMVPLALTRPRFSALWLVPLAAVVPSWLGWYSGWANGELTALGSAYAIADGRGRRLSLALGLRTGRRTPQPLEAR